MKLSSRCKLLGPSATLAINALAKERAKEGLPVFNLSTGEPDFPTPENVRQAAVRAMEAGATRYTAVGGTAELKKAIQEKFVRELGVNYSARQITCSNGGKQILYNLFQVILDEGDEVLCFSPYWLSYKTQVELAGGKLVEINLSAEKNFRFEVGLVEQYITPKSKVILLNSPGNPTGQILSEDDLRQVAEIARQHGLLVISDDVYEYFFYTVEKPTHILKIAPDLAGQTVLVNAVSKTYAMTGWRLGFAAGPEEIIQKMEELQSHSSSNPSSISQAASVEALNGPQDSVETMRLSFLERRNKLTTLMSGLKFILPDGAFYAMIDIREKKKSGESDLDFCLDLLKTVGVAAVPGESFGGSAEGFVRISFANSISLVEEGIAALKKFRARQ